MIKTIYNKLFKPKFTLKPGDELEFVFESGGQNFYKFVNEFKIPYARAMEALDIYEQLEQRVDKKYQIATYQSILEYARQGYLDKVAIEANNALERMENITNLDVMYSLASVLYLSEGEDPYTYDYEIAEKKKKHWQKDKNIDGFFLKTPLDDYLPSFDGLPWNISQYTMEQRRELLRIIKNRLSDLSGKSKNQELILTLRSHATELEALLMNS
jgi:hypothetical protein